MNEHEKKMSDPQVRQAIKTLRAKGITLKQIEAVYRYYDYLQRRNEKSLPISELGL